MRRALAIQLIINREWGLARNENPNQGALSSTNSPTSLRKVLTEFDRISERGVLWSDGNRVSTWSNSRRVHVL